jgi:hypothetical protein
MSLIDIRKFALARAFSRRWRDSTTDHAGLDLVPVKPLQADSILRVEALGLNHLALCIRNVVQNTIGQHSVHIHKQHLHFSCELVDVQV